MASVAITIAIIVVDFSAEKPPEYIYKPGPPPFEITCNELYSAYSANCDAADMEYKNQRLYFPSIKVDYIIFTNFFRFSSDATETQLKNCFVSENIKFKLTDISIMQNIEEGDILNVIGLCQGQSMDGILVTDCWVECLSRDLGVGPSLEDLY